MFEAISTKEGLINSGRCLSRLHWH